MFGRERISCALFVRLESDGRGIKNDPIATIKLNKLTTNDLQQFYNRMSESGRVQRKESQNKTKGLSAKSVRNIHCFISHAMNRAIDEKLISENPTSRCIEFLLAFFYMIPRNQRNVKLWSLNAQSMCLCERLKNWVKKEGCGNLRKNRKTKKK